MTTDSAERPGLASLLSRVSDGAVVRFVFFAMLAGALAVLYIDFRELMSANATAFIEPDMPVLPAFDPEGPLGSPGPAVTTDPALLSQPLSIALTGGGILELTGTIEPGAAERFRTEVEARGEYIRTVTLNSPGGVVDEALQIGELLRARGYDTLVADGALCASSCPLIFASGVERTAAPNAAIGVHQMYAAASTESPLESLRSAGEAMSDAQSMTAVISRHLSAMGVDAAAWLNALDTPPNRLYYFSREELERYRLVTPVPALVPATDGGDDGSA